LKSDEEEAQSPLAVYVLLEAGKTKLKHNVQIRPPKTMIAIQAWQKPLITLYKV
jgi:hypothetical protein